MTRTVKQLFDMTGKTALVTGGSRGLGLQLARALGEAGARIMISSRKEADLQTAAAELKSAGIDVHWTAADCANEKDIHRLAAETLKAFGHVDVLVNNAGAAWGSPAEDHPLEAGARSRARGAHGARVRHQRAHAGGWPRDERAHRRRHRPSDVDCIRIETFSDQRHPPGEVVVDLLFRP